MKVLRLPPRTNGGQQRGAVALEMAILLPVLLFLCFAGIEYGRAISMDMSLTHATRVGADWGATHSFSTLTRGSWETQIKSEVTADIQNTTGFVPANLSVSITTFASSPTSIRVTVATTYLFRPIVTFPGIPSQITMHRSITAFQFR